MEREHEGESQEEYNFESAANRSENIEIKVLLFAQARELTGQKSVTLKIDKGSGVDVLLRALLVEWPCLQDLADSSVIAINQEFVERTSKQSVKKGDEIAFIPPISGG